ncbi:transketolase family protein [Patescibacteria group bacterium]|nr:transketolase family protein [Patescibacteria group bacterium]
MDQKNLQSLCRLIRYDILTSTTTAGSGHPTSSLSGVELTTCLFFGGFYQKGDHFVLSKGHASPLLYSLYHAAGLIDYQKLLTLRKFGSVLEGHPTPRLPFIEVATGSLGQGLSVGVGMALGLRLIKHSKAKVWVLLGDSEMAEGQNWEAMEIASHYKLGNLTAILDVNRLGQNGQTMAGWDLEYYAKKANTFGWETIVIEDGHDLKEIYDAFHKARRLNFYAPVGPPVKPDSQVAKNLPPSPTGKPIMIIAKTVKGKGVSFLENKDGWHGKPLDQEQLKLALKELGNVDLNLKGKTNITTFAPGVEETGIPAAHRLGGVVAGRAPTGGNPRQNLAQISTREAYGDTLAKLGEENPGIVVLDGEVANSTYQNKFAKKFPERFFQMYIAEQNMVSVALGLQKIGFIPFVSSFAAFLTRAFDQIRMSQYSKSNLKIVGSHAGVSIGQDGPSQMGLEDIAMMRSVLPSVVFYPADGVAAEKLTEIMLKNSGLFYLRTTRGKTPIIYDDREQFDIGGLKIHAGIKTGKPSVLVIAAGITLHEALKAQKILAGENIPTTVVDLYGIKPLNKKSIEQLVKEHSKTIVVEDHYPAGGIGEAIGSLGIKFHHLAVRKTPFSGTPEELLHYEEIDAEAIIKTVKNM